MRSWRGPLMHGLVLATTFCVFGWTLASAWGLAAGVMGVVAACLVAPWLHASRFRLLAQLALAFLMGAAGLLVSSWLTGEAVAAEALGPWNAVVSSEIPLWSGLAFASSLALRACALRWRAALVLEGSAVVTAVAATVAAHRDGMIARPLAISDWFWTHGVDPVVAFLALGMAAAVLLGNVLAQQRSAARTAAQMAVVLLLGFLVAQHLHSREAELRAQAGASGKEEEEEKDREERAKRAGSHGGNASQGGSGNRLGDDVPPPSGGGKNRPVAVVVFHKNVKPINGIYYFRHTAFSQFNGVRLVQSTRPDADVDIRQPFPHGVVTLGDPPPPAPNRVEVATDVALLTDHESVFALTDALELSPLGNPDPARFRRAYRAVSSVVAGDMEDLLSHKAGSAAWPDDLWAHYTALPSDPRYLALARQLQQMLRPGYRKDPAALALSIKQHLESTSIYSFNKRHDEAADPTASFLFSEDRRGYCVHLAHSTALLLRALKVPARVSAGYAVPAERLGEGSSLLVKAENAHAWAEIYLRGLGWVPVEVTPERSEVEANPFVERDLQQMLGEMARKHRRAAAPQEQPLQLGRLWHQFTAALPWVLLALLLLAYACKLYRLAAPGISQRAQARTAYRAALDRLSAVGLSRSHGESRERFAARVSVVTPAFLPLTDIHLGAALGSRRPVPQHVGQQALQVGRELRHHHARWRWLLGVLNPVSWLWSR